MIEWNIYKAKYEREREEIQEQYQWKQEAKDRRQDWRIKLPTIKIF
jgi:hypothetical protein